MLIHSATKKQLLIKKLVHDGLSINYQLVKEAQDDLTQYLCTKYNRQALVCLLQLKQVLWSLTSSETFVFVYLLLRGDWVLFLKKKDVFYISANTITQELLNMIAMDNIDHIPSSATASSSFHDTTISIFQKVTTESFKNIMLKLNTDINQ